MHIKYVKSRNEFSFTDEFYEEKLTLSVQMEDWSLIPLDRFVKGLIIYFKEDLPCPN